MSNDPKTTRVGYALTPTALVLALTAACGDSGVAPNPTATTTASAATSTSASVAAMPPACDQYVEKMRACIAKAPEGERAARTKAIDATHEAWTAQAQDPKTAQNLVATCQAALSAVEADATCQ